MAGMSLSTGLISGMDTGTLVSQLMQVEANPQTLLKTKLAATQTDAAAYRAVNTRFDGLRTAAEALTTAATWASSRAVSSQPTSVTVSAGATAVAGSSVTFAVTALAATHTLVGDTSYALRTSPAATADATWPITIRDTATGTARGTVSLAAGATITDAATAINAAKLGVRASVVQLKTGDFRLQVTAETGGSAGVFSIERPAKGDGTAATGFIATATGQDATLELGGGLVATSKTNTFTDLLPGVSFTVSKADFVSTTVSVESDPDAVAAKVSALVSAANGVLSTVTSYTAHDSKTAALKGDSTLRTLAGRVLSSVSSAVGDDGSAAVAGLQLKKDGSIVFDAAKFTAKLKEDPALVQRLFAGTPASLGADKAVGGGDDVAEVIGIAGRLQALAKDASDTATGSLTLLAKSKDTSAKDLEGRITDWDRRLEMRRQTLTRQFTAMEKALGTLQNQSNWLSSQLSSLPSWSSSASS